MKISPRSKMNDKQREVVVVSHVDGDLFENVEVGKEVTINVAEKQWKIAK